MTLEVNDKSTLKALPCEFPDEFAEFQARASTGGTVFGLLRRASKAADDYSDCSFLGVDDHHNVGARRGRSKSLVPNLDAGPGFEGAIIASPRTPGDGATDSDSDLDNSYLRAYQSQPRRFSAACGDARDVTSKHNIKVSISPAPSSKSLSSTSRLHDDPAADFDDWALPVYGTKGGAPYRRTSEADIDRLRPPEWSGAPVEPDVAVYRRRSFSITRRGIVNEGDFFVDKLANCIVPASSVGSDLDQGAKSPRSRASSFNSQGSPALSAASSCDTPTYRVLVLGATGVGKTALIQQFMTSEYMGAQNTSFDMVTSSYSKIKLLAAAPLRSLPLLQGTSRGQRIKTRQSRKVPYDGIECTVPVCLDGEESFIEFTDLSDPENAEEWKKADIDGFVLVYSVTDRASFQKAIDLLYNIRNKENSTMAVILVANKSDLMRARVVAEQEGKSAAGTYDCKYIEVSAALNHKVDELLVGITKQIRLNPDRLKKRKKKRSSLRKRDNDEATTSCLRKARENVLVKILSRSSTKVTKSCENLLTL